MTSKASDVTPIKSTSQQREISAIKARLARPYSKICATAASSVRRYDNIRALFQQQARLRRSTIDTEATIKSTLQLNLQCRSKFGATLRQDGAAAAN